MKIDRLVMRGVGAFLDEQVIDFAALTSSRLFLIDGPTGAGKSTIIDAIVFALYGGVAGSKSSEDRIRSTRCTDDDLSTVELSFSIYGRQFFITRTSARTKAGRATPIPESVSMWEIGADGEKLNAMSQARAVGTFLTELLGMDQSAFRRLVVLPQGEFAELLLMKPTERFAALKGLMEDVLYSGIAKEFEKRLGEAESRRAAADSAIEAALNQAIGALGDDWSEVMLAQIAALGDLSGPAAYEALGQIVVAVDSELATARASAAANKAVLDEAERLHERTAQLAKSLASVHEATEALERTRGALDATDAQRDDDELRRLVAELPERVGALRPLAQWEEQADDRAREAAERRDERESLQKGDENLVDEERDLPERITALETEIAETRVLADSKTARAEVEAASARALESLTSLNEKQARLEVLHAHWEKDGAALESARDAHAVAVRRAQEVVDLQLSQRAAALAQLLVDGSACPVCGALEHPTPAVHSGDEPMVTDDDVEAARAHAGELAATARVRETARDASKATYDAAKSEIDALRGAIDGRSQLDLEEAHRQAKEALAAAIAAEKRLPQLLEDRSALASRSQRIADERAAIAVKVQSLEAAELAAQQSDTRIRQQIEELAEGHASAAAALEMLTPRLAAAQKVVEGIDALSRARSEVPAHAQGADLDAATADVALALEAKTSAEARAHASAQVETRLATIGRQARLRHEDLGKAIDSAADVLNGTEVVISVAKVVLARPGANVRKIPLESYVVQRTFDKVLSAASAQLLSMSGGRYAFELDTNTKGNANTGLGISILDGLDGRLRDPGTLSGGERFYAALSLALGLAEVVRGQAGGAPMETLFVDEGFGSLDVDTLSTVVEQIERLRDEGRVVGVISHVTEMKRHFPERIEVLPNGDGTSRISWLGTVAGSA